MRSIPHYLILESTVSNLRGFYYLSLNETTGTTNGICFCCGFAMYSLQEQTKMRRLQQCWCRAVRRGRSIILYSSNSSNNPKRMWWLCWPSSGLSFPTFIGWTSDYLIHHDRQRCNLHLAHEFHNDSWSVIVRAKNNWNNKERDALIASL